MSSPTQRSLNILRERYPLVEVVEHWNPFARIRKDLFGWADLLCVDNDTVIAVQVTSKSNMSARRRKIREAQSAALWLESPNRKILLHGWHKVKGRWVFVEEELKNESDDTENRLPPTAAVERKGNNEINSKG